MLLLTFPRIITLGLTFSFLRMDGFIPVVLLLIFILLSVLPYHKIDGSKLFLGVTSSLFAPCIILDDISNFYLTVSMSSTIFYIILYIFLPIISKYGKYGGEEQTNKLSNQTSVCLANQTTIQNWINNVQNMFDIDEMESTPLILLGITYFILTLGIIYFMHKYLDPIFRLKMSKLICKCLNPIWNSEHTAWLRYISKLYAHPEDFASIDEKAYNNLGSTILEFAVGQGYFHLTQVRLYIFNNFTKKTLYHFL